MSLKDQMRKKKQALAAGKDDSDGGGDLKSHLSARKKKAQEKGSTLRNRMQAKADEKEDDDDDDDDVADEELAAEIEAAQDRFQDLVKRVQLTDIVEETTALGNKMVNLPEAIAGIRSRGYTFRSYLEGKIDVMAEQWDGINDRIELWLDEESADLDDELADAEKAYQRLKSRQTASRLAKLTTALDVLEAQVEASEDKIKALYDAVNREMSTTSNQIAQVNKQLDWLEESDVSLNAGEGLYMAAEAEWDDNRDKPDGFIYVTNQRVIFEQSEKKGGMMGFGGKKVKEVLWEVSHSQIEKVVPSNEGFGGGKDMMTLKLGSGAPYAEVVAEIKGGIEADYWAQQVSRAAKGVISDDSTVEPDADLIERLRDAPTDCPNCGGVLPQLAAGATDISCQYCGSVVRV
ncbi:MAG: hypothetical protein WBC91_13270 [Phototrophicaceae bacterium]